MYDNGIVNQAMQMQLDTKPYLFGIYATILHRTIPQFVKFYRIHKDHLLLIFYMYI